MGFLFGFVLGVIVSVGILIALVYVLFLDKPNEQGKSPLETRVSDPIFEKENEAEIKRRVMVYTDEKVWSTCYNTSVTPRFTYPLWLRLWSLHAIFTNLASFRLHLTQTGEFFLPKSNNEEAERCEWFNKMIQRVFMEYQASTLENKYRQRLNAKFAKASSDRPPFLVCFSAPA